MCHCHAKYSLITIILVVCGTSLFAQTTASGSNPTNGRENNPYSQYGIGELKNGNNAALIGMGSITSAYYNAYRLNTDNPASYSFLQRTTFELGLNGTSRTITGTLNGVEQTYKTGTASIAYLNLAVPVTKNGGFCLGFKPVSNVYYKLADTISAYEPPFSPIGRVEKIYSGEGGLNYAYLGGSAKYKGLSVGFNAGYTFGTIRNSTRLNPIDSFSKNNAFTSDFSNYTRIGGIQWKGGLMYEVRLDSFHTLRIGGTISTNQNLKQHFSEYHIAYYNFKDTVTRDTSYNLPETEGRLTMPLSYSVGIMLTRDNKWGVGVDYKATKWSEFGSDLNSYMNTGIAASSYRISVGGEYTPDAENLRHYLSRGTYRLGAYYGTDYLQLQNTSLPYYGITAGASLPFRRTLSQVHAAIDVGVLGTTENNLNRHNYVRFTLGISLNDLWFVKRRLE